jgi:cell wall-associated NlpC family hydrolase
MQRPEPGDFGVVATAGPWLDRTAARIIRWGTNSPVNHAFVYIGNGKIVEAVRRVRIGYTDEYDDITWSTGRLPERLTPSTSQRDEIVTSAMGMVGDKYNILDILAIGIAQKRIDPDRMTHWAHTPPWYVRRLNANHREICSQVVDAVYLAAGLHLFDDGRLPGLVSPGDLYNLLLPASVTAA